MAAAPPLPDGCQPEKAEHGHILNLILYQNPIPEKRLVAHGLFNFVNMVKAFSRPIFFVNMI